MTDLVDDVRRLLTLAAGRAAPGPGRDRLDRARLRLDEPLRVAIAGRVKAGKSTLLNALVGERVAPTDAGECTRIPTWYRDGLTYRVLLHPAGGGSGEPVRFERVDGSLQVDLGGRTVEQVERLEVEWPSPRLRSVTLIDTPGIDSLSAETSRRAVDVLTDDDAEPGADAVLYLMRHLHASDARFLEAFHDDELTHPTPVNALGVLSRADEVGVCRPDAVATARRIADRYTADPRVRRLCPVVLPVAGLLAETGATLEEGEFRALAALAAAPSVDRDGWLRSVDDFRADDRAAPVDRDGRARLLDRLGLFGVRVALDALARDEVTSASGLADLLTATSGIDELRDELGTRFADRAATLKARSALSAVRSALDAGLLADPDLVATELERLVSSAHELAEIRLLDLIRSGASGLSDEQVVDAGRLLEAGPVERRLGVEAGADGPAVRAAALDALTRWRTLAEHPLASRAARDSAGVVVRTCEGLLVGLPPDPAASGGL